MSLCEMEIWNGKPFSFQTNPVYCIFNEVCLPVLLLAMICGESPMRVSSCQCFLQCLVELLKTDYFVAEAACQRETTDLLFSLTVAVLRRD